MTSWRMILVGGGGAVGFWEGKVKERGRLEVFGANVRMILKQILKKADGWS